MKSMKRYLNLTTFKSKIIMTSFFAVIFLFSSIISSIAYGNELENAKTELDILAPSAILVEKDSGKILYEKNKNN